MECTIKFEKKDLEQMICKHLDLEKPPHFKWQLHQAQDQRDADYVNVEFEVDTTHLKEVLNCNKF